MRGLAPPDSRRSLAAISHVVVSTMRRAAPTERRVPVLPEVANQNVAIVRDRRSSVLLRLLVTRLAVVRDGAAALQAFVAAGPVAPDAAPGLPSRADLERLRDAQLRRAALLERAIREIGGQPARALRAVGTGPLAIHWNDDELSPCHTLERVLAGPLRDDDAWLVLADLANEAGCHELSVWLARAAADHDHDRASVVRWVQALHRPRPEPPAQDSGVTTSSE